MCNEQVSEDSGRRCGWLFNVGLTAFIAFLTFVDALFSNLKEGGSFGRTNLALLPWVRGSSTAEALTGLTIIALVLLMSCVFIWQTWNRLITRVLGLREIFLGEAYAIMLWIVLIALLKGS